MNILKPVGAKITVRRSQAEEKIGNIHLPDTVKEKRPCTGTVLLVGTGKHLADIRPGDLVWWAPACGVDIKHEGMSCCIVHEEDILATLPCDPD